MYSSCRQVAWEPVSGLEIPSSLAEFQSLDCACVCFVFIYLGLSFPVLSQLNHPSPIWWLYLDIEYVPSGDGRSFWIWELLVDSSSLTHWQFNPERVTLLLTFPVPQGARLNLLGHGNFPVWTVSPAGAPLGSGKANLGPSCSSPIACVLLGELFVPQSLQHPNGEMRTILRRANTMTKWDKGWTAPSSGVNDKHYCLPVSSLLFWSCISCVTPVTSRPVLGSQLLLSKHLWRELCPASLFSCMFFWWWWCGGDSCTKLSAILGVLRRHPRAQGC